MYIYDRVDVALKDFDISQKKAEKKLKKLMKTKTQHLCDKSKFPRTMGISPGGFGKDYAVVLENAVQWARSAGWGRNDPDEFRRVATGEHEDLKTDAEVGKYARVACKTWTKGIKKVLMGKVDELLTDGDNIADWTCYKHLKLCNKKQEKIHREYYDKVDLEKRERKKQEEKEEKERKKREEEQAAA